MLGWLLLADARQHKKVKPYCHPSAIHSEERQHHPSIGVQARPPENAGQHQGATHTCAETKPLPNTARLLRDLPSNTSQVRQLDRNQRRPKAAPAPSPTSDIAYRGGQVPA